MSDMKKFSMKMIVLITNYAITTNNENKINKSAYL